MKKIFYILASAIVALGAVACQNEVDENITPGTQNDVVSFTVSFDDNTRIALGTVENGEANFEFEANETLYLNYNNEKTFEFTNTPENRDTFTGTGDGLSEIFNNNYYVTISNKEDLLSPSDVHTTFGKAAYFKFQGNINGVVTLSLSNYVIRCATGADEVTLYCNSYKAAAYMAAPESLVLPANGEYWINLKHAYTDVINVSYEINDETVKSAELDAMVNDAYGFKIFNLGYLGAAVAEVNGVKYTDLSKALAVAGTTEVVTLLKEGLTIDTACIISKESPTFNVADGYEAGFNNNYIVLPVTGTTYLVPNENWKSADAWFAAWQWGETDIMVKATDTNEDGIYEVPVLNNNTNINFNRMNPAKTIADMWEGKWNEAAGAAIEADKYYYVTSWNGGIWESATWERPTNVIYFAPGPWTNDNAKISAWTWIGTGEGAWATKKFVDSAGVIAFDHTSNWTDVIFLRTSGQENTWDGEWNRSQTTVPNDGKNQYTVNDWDKYQWELNQ